MKGHATALLFLHALSPLHPGTGQGLGAIDLPIAREKATGIPYLPGSSLKGVLRDRARGEGWDEDTLEAVFGPETERASEHAGALQVGDARLLLLPVRSLYGVFAHVTSPYLLERFLREARMVGLNPPEGPAAPPQEGVAVAPGSHLVAEGRVFLEDLDLGAQAGEAVGAWEAWLSQQTQAPIGGRMAVVHDDLMGFLLETATEVVARIRLEDTTKTVAKGALWYEESLPTESVLYSLVRTEASHRKAKPLGAASVLELFQGLVDGQALQLGGKATVGRGLCRVRVGR
ncbi:type III-B CRISPR module RAMP protein Cmr4 [Thermus sp.]|uniref:type III-B CRISPR module RAMP protein Cmr4 n=1 Tax=Thermus sp. TaxID=275 RepID=UPI0025F5C2D0|nr:type III-B CRISPR module RAMP protein Cmr4 [Thermus sp.]MCS6869150.1 type III-B CRISPR module RAMP protein Cmr4 [Thermus sp.]MCX7850804.1 type III-B CRISPR module RAMP protein Cmr4 [Thermus sp.]MDW8358554.1 type III-B CRISPR module RAMP protein Cmr4 [Thermus sp.]